MPQHQKPINHTIPIPRIMKLNNFSNKKNKIWPYPRIFAILTKTWCTQLPSIVLNDKETKGDRLLWCMWLWLLTPKIYRSLFNPHFMPHNILKKKWFNFILNPILELTPFLSLLNASLCKIYTQTESGAPIAPQGKVLNCVENCQTPTHFR